MFMENALIHFFMKVKYNGTQFVREKIFIASKDLAKRFVSVFSSKKVN